MPELEQSRGNRWLTTLTFQKSTYEDVIRALASINVESRPLWKPMHLQPLFKDSKTMIDGTSQKLFEKGLCLASSTTLTQGDVVRISTKIKEICCS
jgi:UDP-N-acetylbacillosamine transaminase